MERKPRIALLIDADNAPASKIDLILNELSGLGETNIRRAYGNWTKPTLKGWADVLHEHAIQPIQQYDVSKGKNASDMALTVDAMALLYTETPDAFGIVSSDADFTPLVMHLKQRGAAVYGFGQAKTPAPFVSACSRFLQLEKLVPENDETATDANAGAGSARLRVPPDKLKRDSALMTLLRNAIGGATDESGWARVGTVGQHIGNQSSFDHRNYGYASLSKLLKAIDLFEMRDEGTVAMSVRDRRRSD
jgi:uncharacterized LabA/DUF88 family protein